MTEHKGPRAESPTKAGAEAEESSDLGPTHSGVMGGGASGPRKLSTDGGREAGDGDIDSDKARRSEQTGGSGTGTQGSSNVAGQRDKGSAQHPPSPDRDHEDVENYGSRRDDVDH